MQRVTRASVRVGDRDVSAIGSGLLVLVAVGLDDDVTDVEYVAKKIRGLRLFEDEAGKLNRAVGEVGGEVLLVSQFTLYGDCRKGRRPSFDLAAPAPVARERFGALERALRDTGVTVHTGEFRATMDVELVNHGPVTVLLDSGRAF